ncbi:pyridoxamine 5'-phosphate oxidase family protein [Terrihabitans sp. B22-R8]|uniref:pyridoxamine 5'-phosphate oxidase family protein n=1 Tax=Terrihabitans sp. B22-R8 TaxID=3425128 RepID=UPI00403C389D
MTDRTDQAAKDKVLEILKDTHITMLATRGENGVLHARPMGVNHAEFDGDLWFLTALSSEKVAEIEADPEVLLTYADTSKQNYVSISGKGRIVRDRALIEKHWFEPARTWFPEGKDDPNLGLIQVSVDVAEYWDSPSSTVLYLYGYVKAAATGKPPKGGENETVSFK